MEPTNSQLSVSTFLLDRLIYPGFVNLNGKHGVGKTFLGWHMDRTNCVQYCVEPTVINDILPNSQILFIDNAGYRRSDYRAILGKLERQRVNKAIIVTNERIEDDVTGVELKCNSQDIQTVSNSFLRLGIIEQPIINVNNLWDLFSHATLGEYNVK